MWIKICGITTFEAAMACAAAGADAVGFVFTESKRKIPVEVARWIIELLPRELKKVGVFVDAPEREVSEIQGYLGLDLLQFHGTESPLYCSRFPGKAIKAFRISSAKDLQAIGDYRGKICSCLLDSYIAGESGGTGRAWDWNCLKGNQNALLPGVPVILAGGLHEHNVAAALRALKPQGIDVSSGVERGGRKDLELIRQFINTVRRCEHGELT